MAKISRNLLDGKKRQASLLGSTLTSLTLNSENDTTSSEEEDSVTDSDSSQEETNEESCQKSGDESDTKSNARCLKKGSTDASSNPPNKKQPRPGKEKPKVRMKTLTIDGQLVYFCVICDKIFTKKKDKMNHELAHSNETLISCPECGKDFFHESSLAHHIRSHDGEQLHFCDFCPKMFAQSHQLKAHTLSHSNPSEITCKICRMDFKSSSDLNCHNRKKIKEEMAALWCNMCKLYCCRSHCIDTSFSHLHAFRCFACNELFYTMKKLKLHAKRFAHKINQSNKSWKSSVSDINETDSDLKLELSRSDAFTINRKRQIENSDQDEGPESKKSCTSDHVNHDEDLILKEQPETERISTLKMDIEYPRKICKPQRKPYCKKCNRSFKETSDLISHKLSAHSISHGSICRHCGEEFSSNTDLKQHTCRIKLLKSCNNDGSHVKNVKEDVPNNKQSEVFKCNVCTKTFSFLDQLQNHLRLHNNIKSFQCYLCQRNFVTKHYLQRHLQVHIKDGSIAKDYKGVENGTSTPDNENKEDILSDDDLSDIKIDCAKTSSATLKFKLGKENIYSFSDDSASSFVNRESEKSDNCLSSASSHSFKISMAKERRKLKKRRSLSKSLLCKKLSKKRVLLQNYRCTEKSVVYVDKLPDRNENVNNFVVEINGANSELSQETTIFVDLTHAKLVSKDTAVLHPLDGIDKENTIPYCDFSDNDYNSECHNWKMYNSLRLRNTDEMPCQVLSDKVMVLDLEVEDFDDGSTSTHLEENANPKLMKKTRCQPLITPSSLQTGSKTEQLNYTYLKHDQSFNSDGHQDDEAPYLQPLHSLHLMTAKFSRENEKPKTVSPIKPYSSEFERKMGSISNIAQDSKSNRNASGKTCRDIAASWKSNRSLINSSVMNESRNKPELLTSKDNDSCFGVHSKRSSAFKSVSRKPVEFENTCLIDETVSSNIKREYSNPSSSVPFSDVNTSALGSHIVSFQPLPPSFCKGSQETSSYCRSSSHTIKSEFNNGQENHCQSSLYSSCSLSSVTTSAASSHNGYDMKCNITGRFSMSSSQSATDSSQPNNVFHFDTDNPALRDMNLMEMVCSIQTQIPSTSIVTQPENPFQFKVSTCSNNFQVVKREIECDAQSLSRNVKTEQTYPLQADSSRDFRCSVNSPRSLGFENSLPPNVMNLSSGMNIINPNLDHINVASAMNPVNLNTLRPPFQQPDWSVQLQTPFPHQGANPMSNAFPLSQVPVGNDDLNLNRFTNNNNAENLIIGHPNQYGLPSPLGPGITNHIPTLPPLHFGHQTTTIFQTGIMPVPLPLPPRHPPPPPMLPAMLPNGGVFYLPF